MDNVSFDCVATKLPPDAPYFIKTTQNYEEEYKEFLDTDFQEKSFLVNPGPRNLEDIIMKKSGVHFWFRNVIRFLLFIFSFFLTSFRNRVT